MTNDDVVIADLIEAKAAGTHLSDQQGHSNFSVYAVLVASQDTTLLGSARVEQLIAPRGIQFR